MGFTLTAKEGGARVDPGGQNDFGIFGATVGRDKVKRQAVRGGCSRSAPVSTYPDFPCTGLICFSHVRTKLVERLVEPRFGVGSLGNNQATKKGKNIKSFGPFPAPCPHPQCP